MALLIPLLLPHVVEAATNIGIGISNAVQGTSSNVTLQIGGKVFTTRKKFNFLDLPYELRWKIVLMALDMSKSLILPAPYFFHPHQPMTPERMQELQKQHPLHPDNDNYGSIVGDRVSANGYPVSSWRWMRVSREWREMLQRPLWEECDVAGSRPYRNLERILQEKRDSPAPRYIRSITLREGYPQSSDLYTLLSHPNLVALEEIAVLPDWPTPYHPLIDPITPFPFGLQLLRAQRPLKSLTFGLPLEGTTNEASRQQLKTLAVPALYLSFARPSLSLFDEVKRLVVDCTTTLGVRYVTNRITIEPDLLLSEPLQAFPHVEITLQLPRTTRSTITPLGVHIEEDLESPTPGFVSRFLAALERADDDVQERYTVFHVEGWQSASETKQRTTLWPIGGADVEPPRRHEEALRANDEVSPTVGDVPTPESRRGGKSSQWERQTNYNILGGLIGLSLESKKYG